MPFSQALLCLQGTEVRSVTSPREPIAIVGIGCRFPGESSSPRSYWKFLTEGTDAVTEVPPDRWLVDAYYHPDHHAPGRIYARWGGFIRDIDQFDASFFGISPREAARMDPQQRLLLEVADEAFQDAGWPPTRHAGSNTGVFVGLSTSDYAGIQTASSARNLIDAFTNLGVGSCITANRISYHYDFHGPSFVVDTACSSSLVAVSMACKAIWNGECDVALSGAVNLILRPENTMGFSKSQMLSPQGRCKSFDADASGYVRSEGVGAVVLRPLSQALADGDRIYAVIRAADLNQDGRTGGIALPNGEAQAALLTEIYTGAGLDPAHVRYVEAHGTGTAAGDPIEVNALGSVLRAGYQEGRDGAECLIGSVKSNMGHLEAASGMAGLIKAALSLHYREIPGNLHFSTPNPAIPFDRYGLRVAVGRQPWPTDPDGAQHFLTGINSFGFGGTNAHVVLDTAPPVHRPGRPDDAPSATGALLFPFSAHSQEALRRVAQTHLDTLDDTLARGLPTLARALGQHRDHHAFRLSLAASSVDGLRDGLQAFLDNEHRPGMAQGRVLSLEGSAAGLPLAFVFSGMGPQWWAMGRELLAEEPVFRGAVEEIDALLTPFTGWSLLEELGRSEAESQIDETYIAQPSLFAVQVALARVWTAWGVTPDVIVGHSLGEVAAAHVAGALSLPDAVHLIYQRSRLQHLTSGQGRMLAAELSPEQATALIAEEPGQVSIAAINSATDLTLAGDAGSLERLAEQLNARGIFNSFLKVEVPFHSPVMEQIRTPFFEAMHGLVPQAPKIPMVSTVSGRFVEGAELDVTYWWRNVRESVQFSAAIGQILASGPHVLLEISAHPALSGSMGRCIKQAGTSQARQSSVALPSLRRREPERVTLLGSLGRLYTLGRPLDWARIQGDARSAGGPRLKLPLYPWQHERFWNETPLAERERLGLKLHPLLGERLGVPQPVWENVLSVYSVPGLREHVVQGAVVFPGAGYVEMALAAAHETFGEEGAALHDLNFLEALVLPPAQSRVVQSVLDSRHTLSVHSAAPVDLDNTAEGAWTLHARTTLVRLGGSRPAGPEAGGPRKSGRTPQDYQAHCAQEIPREEFYARFRELGLQYGPAFQGLQRLWTGEGEAFALLAPPPQTGMRLPPSVLDACFQLLLGAVVGHPAAPPEGRLYLPVQIRRLTFYAAPMGELYAHACLTRWDEGQVSGDLTLMNARGDVFAEVAGLQCQAIDAAGPGIDSLLYRYRWEPQALAGPGEPPAWAVHWPVPEDLLRSRSETLRRLGTPEDRGAFAGMSARLAALYSQAALGEVGLGAAPGELLTVVQQLADGAEAPPHPAEEAAALWRSLWARFPGHQAELYLLASAGNSLEGRLRGQDVTPSAGMLEHLWQDSPSVRGVHALTSELLGRLLKETASGGARSVRVLELGAAGGELSAALAGVLTRHGVVWTQADRDPDLLAQAAARLGLPGVPASRGLDLSRDLSEQGWEAQTYDLIVGTDGPYSQQELGRLQALLVPGGVLALQQTLQPPAWQRLWPELWRPARPLADWMTQLGFEGVSALPDAPEPELAFRSLIWGRLPVDPAVLAEPLPDATPREATRWLILADDAAFAARLEAELRQRSQSVLVASVPTPGPDQASAFAALLASPALQGGPTGVVFAWTSDLPPSTTSTDLGELEAHGTLSALALPQALARTQAQHPFFLWLVTRGAQAVSSEGAPHPLAAELWGLGRVLQVEYPMFSPRSADLDPRLPAGDSVPALVRELLSSGTGADAEDELAFRENRRFVHRLTRPAPGTLAPAPGAEVQEGAYRLTVPRPGVLNSLTHTWVPRRAPAAGEIEVQVQAAALNFKDVMLGLGMLPDEALEGGFTGRAYGMEAAGEVVRLGEGQTGLKVGDRVVICARDALSTHLTVPATFAVRTPAHLSSEAAASVPIAFMTAYYALHHLARMGPDDRVLIHAAAGGVGLAAISLAQRTGATIFATAGTPEKRELLHSLGVQHVFDSRTLNFAEEILEITGGQGVDIVLNSLSGDAIGRSLAVLRPYGRFVEIGKRDIYQNSPLDLGPFRNNLSYFAVDLDRMWVDRPQLTHSLLAEVMGLFERQELAPISHRVFPFQGALRAFRFMAQAKHTGKVVLAMDDQVPAHVTRPVEAPRLRPDGYYLLTGGLGGFGLALAAWLVDHGARRLVLVGRSGAGTAQARSRVKALRARGAEVRVERADIADSSAMQEVLADVRRSGPLLGVFHAAMVIDDVLIGGLTPERFTAVTRPKVQGGWNLHRLTLGDPLEVFMGFSSVSAMLGNFGQASYAAANAFLDALAEHRQGLGLPALTVSWGAVADVGYLAAERGVAAQLESAGVPPVPVARLLAALEALWFTPAATLGVAAIHWPQLALTRGFALPPRLHGLLGDAPGDAGGQREAGLLDAWAQLGPEERREALFARISEQLARILGTSPGRLDPDQAIMKMGVDSLMAVELGGQIQAETGVKIPPMKFVGGVTLRGLTEFVLEGLDLGSGPAAPSADLPESDLEVQVGAMPEDQLDALLSELLGAPQETTPPAQESA